MDHPNNAGPVSPAAAATPSPAPDRDDGLNGSPDWNSGSVGDDQISSDDNW
jgi:hypothetical protein